MIRVLIVPIVSLLCISLQAQLISFDALKVGVIDVTEIKKELFLNGFTKVTASPDSNTDTYAYYYDETVETASIRVLIDPIIELENAGLYSIMVLTYGDYIHDDLVKEIKENCTFDGTRVGDELVYTCDYTTFAVSFQDLHNYIVASPNFEQLPMDSPFMEEIKKVDMEEIKKMDMGEVLEYYKEMEEKEKK
jgi:hypothetical protein